MCKRKRRLNKKSILSFFVAISANLLPLTKKSSDNEQYRYVQPIVGIFVERCISPLLATNMLALKMLIYAK